MLTTNGCEEQEAPMTTEKRPKQGQDNRAYQIRELQQLQRIRRPAPRPMIATRNLKLGHDHHCPSQIEKGSN